jgi:hypothetical protein
MTKVSRPSDKFLQEIVDLFNNTETSFEGLKEKSECHGYWRGAITHSTFEISHLEEEPKQTCDGSDWPNNEYQKNDPGDRHDQVISPRHGQCFFREKD